MTACPKTEIIRDREHLDWIKTLPCLVSGFSPCDPHHIKRGWLMGGVTPSDNRAIPLTRVNHSLLHNEGELRFLYKLGGWGKCLVIGKQLHEVTLDTDKAMELIRRFKR